MNSQQVRLLFGVLCGALLCFLALLAVGAPPRLAAASVGGSLYLTAILLAAIKVINWVLDCARGDQT